MRPLEYYLYLLPTASYHDVALAKQLFKELYFQINLSNLLSGHSLLVLCNNLN